MNYFSVDKTAIEAAEAEIFAAFREQVRAVDPDAVAEDGSIISRNAATGELEPNATRTTGYSGTPRMMVQGWTVPEPEEEDLQLVDPAATGVELVEQGLNPWPARMMDGEATPLPEWVQPLGAGTEYRLGSWVQHGGLHYESLLDANVWEPSPESNFWRISPDPGPLPWKQPTGSMDAYATGDQVTHTAAGRDTDLWESNIAANTQEPGMDSTFDRWWKPLAAVSGEVLPWVQPTPGTANKPYEVGDQVTHNGQTWVNTTPLNVWAPGVAFWDVKAAFTAASTTRKRARTKDGRYQGDDPATAENEAWV